MRAIAAVYFLARSPVFGSKTFELVLVFRRAAAGAFGSGTGADGSIVDSPLVIPAGVEPALPT